MCSRVLWLDHGTVRAFGEAAHICDMYMDEKRKSAEYVAGHIQMKLQECLHGKN